MCTHTSAVTTKASLPAAALSFAASVSLLGLSYAEHVYTYRPSTVLSLFLLFSILFDATRTRTLWLQGYNRSAAIAALVATVLKIVMLAVEATEKCGFLRPQYCALPPEVTSGIFSRWIFSWQLPLFRAGYSKKLEIDALSPLEKHFKSSYLQHQLQTRWSKCMSSRRHCCTNIHVTHRILTDSRTASREGGYALLLAVLNTLKWPILSIVFPRLVFAAFTFCQPLLISATLEWAETDGDSDDASRGYGLIGAWFLVFVGIAVGPTP